MRPAAGPFTSLRRAFAGRPAPRLAPSARLSLRAVVSEPDCSLSESGSENIRVYRDVKTAMTAPRPRPQPPPAPSPSGHVTLTVLLLLCLMVGGSPSGSGGAVDVLPSRFGSFNFDELEHLKYNMEISSRPVSEADTSNSEVGSEVHGYDSSDS